jgi:2,4-dienoyl-CoA reductase-like NADH-dependent reductase (Old Yellow Enzyme family)/thioredoxin reductase
MNPFYPKLFEPFTIKRTTFRNRIFSAPNMMSHMDFNGRADDSMISYFAEKARGGAATVTLGETPVDREHAAINPRSFAITTENMPIMAEIVQAIHEGGALACHELNHGGRTGVKEANIDTNSDPNWEPWGPVDDIRWDGQKIHGMTEEEMNIVADHFADKAEILKDCGYDMVLLHGGHGWLLDQFLSPLYNTRTDEYGGSLENRAKFPLMVIDRVRQRCGENFLIEYRMSGSQEIEGGLLKEEGVKFAQMIDGKVDLIHVSAAMDTEEEQAVRTHPTMFLPHGVNVHYAAAVKAAGVKTPVVTIGAISDPAMAEDILEKGQADVIGMVRALIADPWLPEKARHGHPEDIIPCLRCLDCLTGMHENQFLKCAVNPLTAREERCRNRIQPPTRSLKVLVVGGGPGGLKAAATAADRGHEVVLAEASDELGGLLKFTDYDDLKVDLMRLKNYLITQVKKRVVDIRLDTPVTPEYIRLGGFDAVILAVGSSPAKPPIPGLNDPSVLHATEIYTQLDQIGKNVAVLGGGLVGCETGLFLAERGHDVHIIEMQEELAPEANWMHKEGMRQAFEKAPITTLTSCKVAKILPGEGVEYTDANGNAQFLAADSIVYAMGMRSNKATVEELSDIVIDTIPVGDCVQPRKARQAMEEAFWAVIRLT